MLNTVAWTHKYRPTNLDEVAMSDENRALLSEFLTKGEIPHLLLSGPAGTGKTTCSLIITKALDCDVLTLNASNERGIDVIREKVGLFVRGMSLRRWRIVFLDEADQLTPDAQFSLRNLMETYADRARFVLTCNNLHKIIDPIQSRCTQVTVSELPLKERVRIVTNVLAAEGIPAEPTLVLGYAQRFKDMRKLLNVVQKAWLTHKGVLPPANEAVMTGADILAAVGRKDWKAVRAACNDAAFDPQQALREMFFAVPDNDADAANKRVTLARSLKDSVIAPDQVVNFLGTCAELMA